MGTGKIRIWPPGTPLPDGHPLKRSRIIFGGTNPVPPKPAEDQDADSVGKPKVEPNDPALS